MVHMMRGYAFCLLGLTLLGPAVPSAQNSQQDFDVFFAKFKLAAAQKDAATLTTSMMPDFNFILAQGVSASDVFKGLDANGGLQWTNLQHSVQGRPSPGLEHLHTRFAMHANRDYLHVFGNLPAGHASPLALEEHDSPNDIMCPPMTIRKVLCHALPSTVETSP